MPEEESTDCPSPVPPSADLPVLDYPTPAEADSESWPEVFRAMLIVFGFLAAYVFLTVGVCGVFTRGCG